MWCCMVLAETTERCEVLAETTDRCMVLRGVGRDHRAVCGVAWCWQRPQSGVWCCMVLAETTDKCVVLHGRDHKAVCGVKVVLAETTEDVGRWCCRSSQPP